jgi:hypothetical protein
VRKRKRLEPAAAGLWLCCHSNNYQLDQAKLALLGLFETPMFVLDVFNLKNSSSYDLTSFSLPSRWILFEVFPCKNKIQLKL